MVDRLIVIKVNKTIIKLVFEVLSATQKLTERTQVKFSEKIYNVNIISVGQHRV